MIEGVATSPQKDQLDRNADMAIAPKVRISVNVTADFGNVTDLARLGVARFRL